MEEYTRNCPICSAILTHKNKYSRNILEKKKSPCRACSCKIGYIKHGSYIDTINKEVKAGLRKNGFADRKHSIESKKIMSETHKNNLESYKTQEFRDKMSVVTSGNKNPMYGKTVYGVWIEKYGKEEADRRDLIRKSKWSISSSGKNNGMYGKEAPKKAGYGISGWYGEFFFRSLHELQFILVCERFKIPIVSAEKLRFKYISYNGIERTYSPDYIVDNKYLVEVKPKRLQTTPLNLLKFEAAKKYCDVNNMKFKVIDFGILEIEHLYELIGDNLVILNKDL